MLCGNRIVCASSRVLLRTVCRSRSVSGSFATCATPIPRDISEFTTRIKVIGVGGAGCNAVNNMVANGTLDGVDFVCANTDAQHLASCLSDTRIQLGRTLTEGLGGGADHLVGRAAAGESQDEILEAIGDAHLVFITAGMGGGTGTGAAPAIAEMCYDRNILTVAVVTKPFAFEVFFSFYLSLSVQ
jgi:cell division protein FtsZ